MTYILVTLLLFAAYLPLLWIVYRLWKRDRNAGMTGLTIFLIVLVVVWIIGFMSRTIIDGALQHLIVAGSVSTLFVVAFELFKQRIPNLRVLFRFGRKTRFIFVIGLFIIVIIIGNSLIGIRETLRSAKYFEEMVTYNDQDLPFIVVDEIAEIDNRIRLVTKEFAISKAEQNKANFGSNAELAQANVIYVNGSLYWCMIYAPKSSARFWKPNEFNQVLGLILVEVNNPNADPITIEFSQDEFQYAEGLWRNHNINLKNYRRDQNAKYWRSYPAWTGEKWVYVVTRTTHDVYDAWKSDGIDILDIKTGELIEHYTADELDETPNYIIQIYAEVLIEDYWIKQWGNKRDTTADGNIRFFSGFPHYSTDRIGFYGEGVEDIRYVIYQDSPLSFFATHPLDSTETLAGIGVLSKTDVTFYDLRSRGFISATTASQIAKGQLTAPNEGSYIVQMPVPYTLNTSIGHRLCWFVPIYWQSGSVQRLSHICVIDALDSSYIAISSAEGLTGSQVVKDARLQYKAFFTEEPLDIYEIGQIEEKGTYVESGNSIFVFQLNDSHTIRCSQEYLNDTHWNDVVLADVGDTIKYTFTEDEEGILWATEFFIIEE